MSSEEPDTPTATKDQIARLAIGAGLRHAALAQRFATSTLGEDWKAVSPTDALAVFRTKVDPAKEGDMGPAIGILMAQAMTLDTVFTDLVSRAACNLGEYPQAFERYMRLALKAQANSRVTLETVGKLARGGEQVVRHIHVDNRGGQAVIANNLTTGGAGALPGGMHAITTEQSLAGSPNGTPLLGQDASGQPLPVTRHEERAMSDARRHEPGSAAREQECLEARGPIGRDDRLSEGAQG